MKRVGGFEYGIVKQAQPATFRAYTKKERIDLARRRQQQLIQAGVRPRYIPLAGGGRTSNVELKGVDGTLDHSPVLATTNTNAGIVVVNCVQPGSGSWNRVGRKIRMRSLRCKGTAVFNQLAAATSASSNIVRMVLVYDKQPSSGAIPTFDTIFGGTDQSGTESCTFKSNVRYDNTQRFSVLKDMTTSADFFLSGALQDKVVNFDFFINLKKLETVYSGQTVPCTIADISTGALYMIMRADASGVNKFSQIRDSVFRLRYED